jgi:hypothetical protein
MWSVDIVAERFREAAQTARRLPPVRVQGYFNTWPAILRQPWETYSGDDVLYRFPPDPAAIDRMTETMRWVLWLTEEQRHLVWMRAERYRWGDIAKRFGCSIRTAQRRWESSLLAITRHLSEGTE